MDAIDGNYTTNLSNNAYFSVADLYRYSGAADTTVSGFGKVMDLAVGGTPYFSTDRGATSDGLMSTGRAHGDGQQASHWKDNLGLGIMDPTAANGEFLAITSRDLRLFDAIGWNLAIVPEPSSASLFLLLLPVLGFSHRRKRRLL